MLNVQFVQKLRHHNVYVCSICVNIIQVDDTPHVFSDEFLSVLEDTG